MLVAPALREGRVHVGDLPAHELAGRYGTPLYALDARVIAARLDELRCAVGHPRTEIYYSCKANPSPGIMQLLRKLGARCDACSPGDLLFAEAAGFTSEEISYAGCAMSDEEIALVAGAGVTFVADSCSQLARFCRLAPGREVGLRVNCGVEADCHAELRAGAMSKFGIHPPQLPEAVALAERADVVVVGLHAHLGSKVTSPVWHLRLLDALLEHAATISSVRWIDLGGGWGEPGYDLRAFGTGVERRMLAAEQRLGRELTLRLEPGAQLVVDAGCLLARVTEVKPPVALHDGRTTPAFVGTDASSNHLMSAVAYGKRHPVWVAERATAAASARYDVVGNLMQAADVLARDVPLAAPRPGDVLAIGGCGGYAAWRAPCFNERPRPAEVLVDGTRVALLRRAETLHDLLRCEQPLRPIEPSQPKEAITT